MNDRAIKIITNVNMYEITLETTILSMSLFKILTKFSPYLYEPRNDTTQVKRERNSCEKPLIKEKKADNTTKNKIEISKIK
tara:strand:+ start:405 stop:647 length:243 start_codon:yes stop_codon:yes gene_type:complete